MMFWSWYEAHKINYPNLTWKELQLLWHHFPEKHQLFLAACERAQAGVPLEYLLQKAFLGPLELYIEEPLLIPRPETWDWLENFLPTIAPSSVLDLGCGPGTLGMALAFFHPHRVHLTSIDINPVALEVTQINLKDQALLSEQTIHSDWFSALKPDHQFDLIISNPPYIGEEEHGWIKTQYEDPKALFASHGGLQAYQIILSQIKGFLKPEGLVIVEHGFAQGAAISNLINYYGLGQFKPWYDKIGLWRATSFKVL